MIPPVKRNAGFPDCVHLHIVFNEHSVYYEDVEKWIAEQEHLDWVSDEERARAIRENSVWTCQWYPITPVGFCAFAASSYEALMTAVNDPAVGKR